MNNDMINQTYLGELVTGLVIIANSLPANVVDANGDELAPYLLQTAHDLADELELGSEVNFDAEGEPRRASMVDDSVIVRLLGLAHSVIAQFIPSRLFK